MVGNTKFVRGIANLSTKSGRELCIAFPKTPRVEQYFHTSASLAHTKLLIGYSDTLSSLLQAVVEIPLPFSIEFDVT
jgi:hypothetical protein